MPAGDTPSCQSMCLRHSDYAVGRDPAVDAILGGEEMRSLALVGREDGGLAARRVLISGLPLFARQLLQGSSNGR